MKGGKVGTAWHMMQLPKLGLDVFVVLVLGCPVLAPVLIIATFSQHLFSPGWLDPRCLPQVLKRTPDWDCMLKMLESTGLACWGGGQGAK